MPVAKPEQVEFSHQDWSEVVAKVQALAGSEGGWVNLLPEVIDPDRVAHSGSTHIGLGAMFRALGPTVPVATWVMRSGKAPATLGLEHDLRRKVLSRLLEKGITPPTGSVRVQDNPRRGLVLRLPDVIDVEEVLAFLMQAVDDLCPLQLTGNWLAELHHAR